MNWLPFRESLYYILRPEQKGNVEILKEFYFEYLDQSSFVFYIAAVIILIVIIKTTKDSLLWIIKAYVWGCVICESYLLVEGYIPEAYREAIGDFILLRLNLKK